MTALLEVEGLVVRYGPVTALGGVDLRVKPGELVAILGPNGAGKTTLLRAISGLHRVSAGRVVFDSKPITGWRTHRISRAGIAHVPEGRGMLAPLSVTENLLMGTYLLDRVTAQTRLGEVIDLFPVLGERANVKAAMLSGGEQQMLAIARALVSRPRLLMIDEPSMGLAPVVIDDVLGAMRSVLAAGTAVLLTEQNAGLALDVASHVSILVNGRVVTSAAPSEFDSDLLATYLE